MALVEAVVGEFRQQIEDVGSLLGLDATLDRAGGETVALGVHLRLDLLAHRAAQHVGLPERVAAEDLRDLHHLFLVDDDAKRFLQHNLDLGMQIIRLLLAELAGAVGRDVRHRTRPVQRHQRDDVLEAIGAHLDERLAHAGAFQLEHADRLALAEHLVSLGIVERDGFEVDGDAALRHELHRGRQRGERLQPEKVELDQPRRLDPLHVELGRRHVGFRIAVERDEFVERPVADDDAGGVGRGVGIQALERLRDVEHAGHPRVRLGGFAQADLRVDGLLQGDRRRGVLRHQLGELVDLAERHFEDATDVAHHATGEERAEGDDLRHAIRAIAVADVADHLVAAILAEVDIEIRHRHAFRIEEALEQQAEAQRIEIGDEKRIGDERSGARATARPHRNALILRPFDEVGHDEEVAGKAHRLDDVELEREAVVVDLLAHARRDAARGDACRESGLRFLDQHAGLVHGADGKARQDRLAGARPIGASLRDLDRRGRRFGQIGEQVEHFGPRLEPMFRRELAPLGLADDGALRDTDQRVMRLVVGARREIWLVGADQRQATVVGQIDQHALDVALRGDAVALQLDVKAAVEHGLQLPQTALCNVEAAEAEAGIERAARAAGQRDEAGAASGQALQRDVRRLAGRRIEPGARGQMHQVEIARLVLRQKHQRRATGILLATPGRQLGAVTEGDRQLNADDRLNAGLRQLFREFQRAEQVVGVGDGQRRHAVGACEGRQLADRHRAFAQRVGRVDVQVDEAGPGRRARRRRRLARARRPGLVVLA